MIKEGRRGWKKTAAPSKENPAQYVWLTSGEILQMRADYRDERGEGKALCVLWDVHVYFYHTLHGHKICGSM